VILESTDIQQAAELNSTKNVQASDARPVIINTNRHYDYDIFNRQINIHLEVRHKVIGIK
jgi:hypothetical protein